MSVLIVKHVEAEGPGIIEDCLMEQHISYEVVNLGHGDPLPAPDHFHALVILGGPMNVYEEERYPFLKEENSFIQEALQEGKRLLGICLGAQLIAKALGAKVYKAPFKEIGWYDVSLAPEGMRDPFFSELPETFPVFQWHEDTFDLPTGAKLVVTSTAIPHQAFRYGETVYGLQFHLEVTGEMILEWLEAPEDEFEQPHTPLGIKQKILTDTKSKIEGFQKLGRAFFNNFLRKLVKNDHREVMR